MEVETKMQEFDARSQAEVEESNTENAEQHTGGCKIATVEEAVGKGARWLALTAAAALGAEVSSADPPRPRTVGKMAQIPGGKFKIGGVSSHVVVGEVTVVSFQMDVTEVTLAAYREAVQAGVVPEPLSRALSTTREDKRCACFC
jgi:formylglycine-generating enzyme required for sulfatase activity